MVDYYGIRESVRGVGWDNPLNVERLILAESKPIVVIFAKPGDLESDKLVGELVTEGLKDKVWVIDTDNPVTQLVRTIMKAKTTTPTLMFVGQSNMTIEAEGRLGIVKFLKKYSFALLDINDKEYY